jgi:hypothetical protein
MLPLAFLSCTASALTSHQSGPLLDLGAGIGLRDTPIAPSFAGELSFGWWLGLYDDQYAFGRYWAVVGTGRFDAGDGLALTPTLEVRRGLDLIVAGLYGGLSGGAVLDLGGDSPGWTARGSIGAKLRRSRFLGLTLRLEAGVDGREGELGFAGGALLGVGFARPAHRIEPPRVTGSG